MANPNRKSWTEFVRLEQGDETDIYMARARRLGLAFVPAVDLGATRIEDTAGIDNAAFVMSAEGKRIAYVAPTEDAMPHILDWLATSPATRSRLRVSTPSAIRAALIRSAGDSLVREATERLEKKHPDFSARAVVTRNQAAAGIIAGLCMLAALIVYPLGLLVTVNFIGAVFFFGVSAVRFVAAGKAERRGPINTRPVRIATYELPVYSVLVPLYGEAEMVPGLIGALDRIDWPLDRLDIKIVVEASDHPTILAARRLAVGPQYEVVVVPPGGPRTKPKALSFALPFARGEYLTVYDAEDRPHPGQLREAYATFKHAPANVACLQSSLVIDNGNASWLSLLFSVEYAALFDGLLPTLAEFGMPLPLGGTSNHFRRAALEAVGGWDPYNVTEDADLGLRLARFGYRAATIDLPTVESAPTTLAAWRRQRTRWFKGWMQTWLVHTRDPIKLARDLGPRGLLGFGLIGTGLIASSLIYPLYLLTVGILLTHPMILWGDGGPIAAVMAGINLFNLAGGYAAMGSLSSRALKRRRRNEQSRGLLLLPIYWLLMSYASYRAIWELIVRPHHWAKTPHERAAAQPASANVAAISARPRLVRQP